MRAESPESASARRRRSPLPRIPMAGYLTPELDSRSRLGSTRLTTLSRRRGGARDARHTVYARAHDECESKINVKTLYNAHMPQHDQHSNLHTLAIQSHS